MHMAVVSGSAPAIFKAKVESRTAKIGVIGMGYVGLPLALLFSDQKFTVTGFDIDPKKVEALNKGESYIVRILPQELQAAQTQGLTATREYQRLAEMDAVIICVPTPLNEYHEPDMSYVIETVEAVAPHIRAGQLVI